MSDLNIPNDLKNVLDDLKANQKRPKPRERRGLPKVVFSKFCRVEAFWRGPNQEEDHPGQGPGRQGRHGGEHGREGGPVGGPGRGGHQA